MLGSLSRLVGVQNMAAKPSPRRKERRALDPRIRALKAALIEALRDPTLEPIEGMLPLEEFEFPTVEEMENYYRMFWERPRQKYGPDYFRLDPHRDNHKVKGNIALCGMFFYHKADNGKMFLQRRIISPFSVALTRAQWWELLPGLIRKESLWCWLPSIIKATDDNGWRESQCIGWDIYEHRFPTVYDDDVIIGPDGIFTRAEFEARQPEWKGISMFRDITDIQSGSRK